MKKLSEYTELPGYNKTASALLLENGLCPTSEEEFFDLFPDQKILFTGFEEFLSTTETLTGTEEFIKILTAHDKAIPICVLGDFDADGITATVIMVHTLRAHGYKCLFSIPNRLEDGYGEQEKYVEAMIRDHGVKLFITVDSGISFKALVQKVHDLGAEIIITDHHLPDIDVPEDCLIIDPKYTHDHTDGICGAYVALKLAWALSQYSGLPLNPTLPALAGIATITDIMPMLGENRNLVRLTLNQINQDKQYGQYTPLYKILCSLNGSRFFSDPNSLATEDLIGFYIGPAINAISRVSGDVTRLVNSILRCVSSPNAFMPSFTDANFTRQRMTNEVGASLQPEEKDNLTFAIYDAAQYTYPIKGILGLIANKNLSKYNKVSLVGSKKNEDLTEFSGRSTKGYNLHEGIERIRESHPEYEISGGGHAGAMGIRVKTAFLNEFATALDADISQNSKPYEPTVFEFEPEMTSEIIETMQALQPFGRGFERLTFQYTGILQAYDFGTKIAIIDGLRFKMFLSKTWENLKDKEITIRFQPSFDSPDVNFTVKKE